MREVMIACDPSNIPNHLEMNVANLAVGHRRFATPRRVIAVAVGVAEAAAAAVAEASLAWRAWSACSPAAATTSRA